MRETRDTFEDTIDSAFSRQSRRKRSVVRYRDIRLSFRLVPAISFLGVLSPSALLVVRSLVYSPCPFVCRGGLGCR